MSQPPDNPPASLDPDAPTTEDPADQLVRVLVQLRADVHQAMVHAAELQTALNCALEVVHAAQALRTTQALRIQQEPNSFSVVSADAEPQRALDQALLRYEAAMEDEDETEVCT